MQNNSLCGDDEKSMVERYEETVFQGHQKIDQVFATNQSDQYTTEAKEAEEKDWSNAILPPPSGILKNAKALSSIQTRKDVLNIIKPKGQWTGNKGTKSRIRLFKGGQNEAVQIFDELTKNGKVIYQDNLTKIYKLSDDTYITYRSFSKSGPPTIDVKLEGLKNNIKIKFLEE